MQKKFVRLSAVVLALTLTSSAFAAVGGSNPTPQARIASPSPLAVGGSNPTPQVVSLWSLVLSALGF